MNDLTIHGGNAVTMTMTSREIAGLTGKDHAHVMRDIRNMLEALKKDASSFGGIYLDAYGREKPCFNLDRELTMTLVSGYDIPLRHRVVVRLAELEEQVAKPAQPFIAIPQTLHEALRLAADLAEQKEIAERERLAAEARLAIASPKADALDRMSIADGEVCLQTAGKLLQQPPNKFIVWLRSLGTWIFKRPGSSRNSAYSEKINAGYLNVRSVTRIMPDGSERVNEQVVVTPKGLAKLAQMLGVSIGDGPMGGATQ